MSFASAALCYLLLFRLAIVFAGIISVVLGYRLLCKGVGMQGKSNSGSTIESSIERGTITVRNAAPGTCFALFGATLLIITMVQGRPSVTSDTLFKLQTRSNTEGSTEASQSEKVVMRGGEGQSTISLLTAQGIEFERRGDVSNAQRSYEAAVKEMAEPVNDLAWAYLNSGRVEEATGLATLAVQLMPSEARYKDTLERSRHALR